MLTVRALPPRLWRRRDTSPGQGDLAAFYFGALWTHWTPLDRAIAALLAAVAALVGIGRAGWRHGWSGREEALLAGARDRDACLGMMARKGLHRLLNPGAFPLAANPLKNKRIFAAYAAAARLPVPSAFHGAEGDLSAWIAQRDAIIVKPNFSSKGRGIVGYRRSGSGWWGPDGVMAEPDLLDALVHAHRAGAVVQRLYVAHPALAALSPGALPTLRIMTCINEAGAIEACGSILRFSAGGPRPVDNFNAGNLVAAVGDDGCCGPAHWRSRDGVETLDRHPLTNATILGKRVPDFDAAVALALRAHRSFSDGFRVIGWDLGLSADGPLLIEGNWNPGTDIVQLATGRPFGETRLGSLYRHHLAAIPAAGWRAARPLQREPRYART